MKVAEVENTPEDFFSGVERGVGKKHKHKLLYLTTRNEAWDDKKRVEILLN